MKRSSIHKHAVCAFSLFCCLAVVPARAATLGDLKAGQDYAQSHCASCHSIAANDTRSPVEEATPFQKIADTRGMTARALYVFFRTPHPTMPNLVVKGDDVDNIIAYMLSLKSAKQ